MPLPSSHFRPVAPPRLIENAYTQDQYERLLGLVREKGPWTLILSQHFKSPDEVIATGSGIIPEGFTPTWDMFLNPVFRGNLAKAQTVLHPEIEDCFYNPKFLDLCRGYWGAKYARPESMLFNIQGPTQSAEAPHIDATRYRGVNMTNSPIWLMNMMTKTGLFEPWRQKKAQVVAWYYKGRIGGGFTYWPEGPHGPVAQLQGPMWGRAAVIENEMLFHTAQSNGPVAMRKPAGLAINSVMQADPNVPGGWQILTDGKVIQSIPEEEFRLLVHWSCEIFMDDAELALALDHTDDLTHDRVFDMIVADLRARGETFEVPSDPLTDQKFIGLMTRVYDPGKPTFYPEEPQERAA